MTSSDLISSIKRRALVPTSQKTFSDEDILSFCNEEMAIGIVPSVLSMHEEYYVYNEDVPIVNGEDHYAIPYRAMGSKLRDLMFRDSTNTLREMTRINLEEKAYYQQSGVGNLNKFYLEGNYVVTLPAIDNTPVDSNLVFSYYLRPNQLVTEDRVCTITAIQAGSGADAGLTLYTVDQIPSNITVNDLVDFLQTNPSHRTLDFDVSVDSIDTVNKIIKLDTDIIPDGVVVGDVIALAGECIIPQCPSELHVVLAQRVAMRLVEALGDQAGLQAGNQKLAEMENKLQTYLDNRVEGAPQKIHNRFSPLIYNKVRRRTIFR